MGDLDLDLAIYPSLECSDVDDCLARALPLHSSRLVLSCLVSFLVVSVSRCPPHVSSRLSAGHGTKRAEAH
jgi:hypothetical protein